MKLKYNLNTYFDNPAEKDKCLEEIKKILIQNRNVISTFYEGLTGILPLEQSSRRKCGSEGSAFRSMKIQIPK